MERKICTVSKICNNNFPMMPVPIFCFWTPERSKKILHPPSSTCPEKNKPFDGWDRQNRERCTLPVHSNFCVARKSQKNAECPPHPCFPEHTSLQAAHFSPFHMQHFDLDAETFPPLGGRNASPKTAAAITELSEGETHSNPHDSGVFPAIKLPQGIEEILKQEGSSHQ